MEKRIAYLFITRYGGMRAQRSTVLRWFRVNGVVHGRSQSQKFGRLINIHDLDKTMHR